jgi:hypothetical protein
LSKNSETANENENVKTPNTIPIAKFMELKTIMKAKPMTALNMPITNDLMAK